jgi:GntR family transcriptional regulator
MQIQISPRDGAPIYQQVVNQVKHLVASGRLEAGEELPTIRALAEDLLVNPNTIARAYLELERAGIVTKRPGAGTYVAEGRPTLPRRERLKTLAKQADALLVEASHHDIDFESVLELLRERHDHIFTQGKK